MLNPWLIDGWTAGSGKQAGSGRRFLGDLVVEPGQFAAVCQVLLVGSDLPGRLLEEVGLAPEDVRAAQHFACRVRDGSELRNTIRITVADPLPVTGQGDGSEAGVVRDGSGPGYVGTEYALSVGWPASADEFGATVSWALLRSWQKTVGLVLDTYGDGDWAARELFLRTGYTADEREWACRPLLRWPSTSAVRSQ